jgi:1-acyl-sn-glycerol-3-phosphate acyltransferase
LSARNPQSHNAPLRQTGAFEELALLYLLRMFLLGVHFILASAAGLLLGLVRPFNPDNSRLCARLYGVPAKWIMGLKIDLATDGLASHARPAVIVTNHLSNHDLFVFGLVVPKRTVSLGKKSLKWIPLFGQLYWLAGNVLIDRGNAIKAKKAMVEVTDALQRKDLSIWVFVEGTRNHGKGLGPFKKGAFQMAINAGVPIIPVCSSTYINHMRLGQWRSGNVAIKSLEPISTEGLTIDDVPALMHQCRAQMAQCIDDLDRRIESL